MSTDPYTDAINAGAAALVKPYRDPDTVDAFVETFPTIASARVIEAALPHLRASILAEQARPGPCPANTEFVDPAVTIDGATVGARTLRALCDLRAGHAGQHEAEDAEWGHFRWSDPVPADTCGHRAESEYWTHSLEPGSSLSCERTPTHPGWHIAGTRVWDGAGVVVLT